MAITYPEDVVWHAAYRKHSFSLAEEWNAALSNPYYLVFFQMVWGSYLFNL